MVAPVVKPTSEPGGSPSSSSSHRAAASSAAAAAGVASRMPEFWSQALTSQSAASAAGRVPPITQPKNRPDGIAIRPGSASAASSSITAAGSVGPSGSGAEKSSVSSSAVRRGPTGRVGTDASHAIACTRALSSASP